MAQGFTRKKFTQDYVVESDLVLSDVTASNVSITRHGFAPKSPNVATQYLDGTGAYSTPSGTGIGGAGTTTLLTFSGGSSSVFNSTYFKSDQSFSFSAGQHLRISAQGKNDGSSNFVILISKDTTNAYYINNQNDTNLVLYKTSNGGVSASALGASGSGAIGPLGWHKLEFDITLQTASSTLLGGWGDDMVRCPSGNGTTSDSLIDFTSGSFFIYLQVLSNSSSNFKTPYVLVT